MTRLRFLPPLLLALPLLAAGNDPAEGRFQTLAPECAKACAPCLDDFLVVPGYDPKCGSSRGVTAEERRKKLTLPYVWHARGGAPTREKMEPSKEDLRVADALPSLDQGVYGWLACAEVVRVLGPRDMLVTKVRLVDLKEDRAANADALRKAKADLDREKAAVLRALEAKIDAQEKEKKSLQAWSSHAKAAARNQGNNQGNNQGDAFKAKLDETTRKIRALQTEKTEASRHFRDDENELERLAKERLEPRQAADKVQSKLRRELGGTFHLTGFDTAKLRAGGTFAGEGDAGFQVAVAWTGADGQRVLAATDLLKKPLTPAGLRELLAKRKATPADFADAVTKARQGKSGDDAAAASRAAMARWMRPEPEGADKPGRGKR